MSGPIDEQHEDMVKSCEDMWNKLYTTKTPQTVEQFFNQIFKPIFERGMFYKEQQYIEAAKQKKEKLT